MDNWSHYTQQSLQRCRHYCKSSLNSWRGAWEAEEEDSSLGHKRGSGSVWPETTAETTEVRKHWNRTRAQTSEQRSQEEDEGSKSRVDWISSLTQRRECRKETARRPTTQSRLSPSSSSTSHQSSKTAAMIFSRKARLSDMLVCDVVAYTIRNCLRRKARQH